MGDVVVYGITVSPFGECVNFILLTYARQRIVCLEYLKAATAAKEPLGGGG